MTTYTTANEANYLARMGYAEQIGEARAAIGIALVFLRNGDNPSPDAIRQAVEKLQAAELMLQELRHVPQTPPEELRAIVNANAEELEI